MFRANATMAGEGALAMSARHFYLILANDGEPRMRLALPATEATRLSSVLPPVVMGLLSASGISVTGLEHMASQDLSPRELLHIHSKGRQLTAWLA
ncbi:MAG: hypothetical protein DPW14_11280 [Planctomycetes bacterium]|nr:hypothetical protein [Planctomycetota bacterium]